MYFSAPLQDNLCKVSHRYLWVSVAHQISRELVGFSIDFTLFRLLDIYVGYLDILRPAHRVRGTYLDLIR